MDRRKFTRILGAGCAAALATPLGSAEPRVVRMGFIGVGARGTELLRRILADARVDVPLVCDVNEANLGRALALVEKARGHRPEGFSKGPFDYRRMLAVKGFDSVLIATPQELHAAMAIDALRAGKFVGSEVPAATTLVQCRDLVKTQAETRTGYMLLENYCYSQPVMQIGNMARKGVFGELTYAECAYIHDLRAMRFDAAGQLTWRGRSLADISGNLYPTHAAGPVCQWLGVNRSDRLVSLVALASKAAATHEYAVAKFGKDHAAAGIQFRNGDTTNALIRTERGRLIQIRYDGSSPRPSGMGEYALQGTRGAYESAFGLQKVYLEGRSPEHAWEPLEKYQREFEHPYWAERGEEARRAGHGGGDFFVISDFLAAIRGGASPIDVVDAVTWSAIRPLSALSLERGGSAVEFPDFRQSPRP